MSEPFSIIQSRFVSADPTLRSEIRVHTGSEAATSGILRSIERFGGDPSILRYEISPKSRIPLVGGANAVAWTVRAVRS